MTRAEKKSSSRRVEGVACRGGSTSKDGEIRVFQNCLGMSKPCAAEFRMEGIECPAKEFWF